MRHNLKLFCVLLSVGFTSLRSESGAMDLANNSLELPGLLGFIETYLGGNFLQLPSDMALASPVALLGCKPKLKFYFTGIDLKFVSTEKCKANGTVGLSWAPMRASVKLDLIGSKLEYLAFDADFWTAKEGDLRVLRYTMTNGHVRIRNSSTAAPNEFKMNGQGTRAKSNSMSMLQLRANIFDANGQGIAADVQSLKDKTSGQSTKTRQICFVRSVDESRPVSGELYSCRRI